MANGIVTNVPCKTVEFYAASKEVKTLSIISLFTNKAWKTYSGFQILLIPDLPATQGSFTRVRKDATFNSNILMWQLVDDVTQCARECLVTDKCASFKYEYKTRVEQVGSLCALSARKPSESDLVESDGYNYYERLK